MKTSIVVLCTFLVGLLIGALVMMPPSEAGAQTTSGGKFQVVATETYSIILNTDNSQFWVVRSLVEPKPVVMGPYEAK